jgi:hypothetical protein
VELSHRDRVTWWSNRFRKPGSQENSITGKKVLVWILAPFAKAVDIKFALISHAAGLNEQEMGIKNKMAHCLYDCIGQYAENAWTLIMQNIARGNFQNSARDRKRKAAFDCSFYCQSIFCNGVLNLDD